MKETPLHQRKEPDAQYAAKMSAALSLLPKKPKTVEQCASTQRILDRDPSLDEEWFNRPLPAEAIAQSKALREAKTDEERSLLVAERKLDPGQVQIIEAHRRNSKNTMGQSELSATPEEAHHRAVEAFVFSPPAKLTAEEIEKLVSLVGYSDPPPAPREEKMIKQSVLERFLRMFGAKPQPSDFEPENLSYAERQKKYPHD